MQKVTYIGTNYDEIKRLCGDKVLAPYFCMGFSMLSVDTGEGFVSVNEGDTIVREDDGIHLSYSKGKSHFRKKCIIMPILLSSKEIE